MITKFLFPINVIFSWFRKLIYNSSNTKHKRSKIILDTNIWYAIASGEQFKFLYTLNPIYITYLNYDELAVSPNLLTDKIKKVRSVLKSAKCLSTQTIMENTFDYLIKMDNPDYNSNHYKENYDSVNDDVSKIISGEQGQEYYLKHADVIQSRKEQLNAIANAFMSMLDSTRKYVQSILDSGQIHKDVFWSTDHSEFARHVIKDWIKTGSPTKHELSPSFDWSRIELFTAVTEQLLKEYIMTGKLMKANDWYDLFILKYVQPEDKYLTREKFWLEMINKAKMNKYLLR